ncbi:macrolide 2'-phosphotransferase [Arthrobacter sp. CJ23]|uniref:macrolide 2'-phosphotransferase n=1 Tax=Arthrobacter sp. CJ23 TaxID=2972479 RepID=UPI00215CD64E|nr:macrolide 2'-phosphotransferase [Arthrobacter sp. CJ23]UVJ38378.1 macrolide 2'-phosphotransferase [Arthrobacter sp. CJ23]
MRRTPLELAAVATAAVPGLTLTATAFSPDDDADFDSALLLDSEGKRWRVRSPRHPEASTRLETEFMVLRAFAPAVRAELPFLMPTIAGTVRLGPLTTFVYAHLDGSVQSIEDLSAGGDSLAGEIGGALAAVHDLPLSLVNNADLPSYSANEFRQRKLNELDQAATTGKIPPALLRRWEHALEEVALWRFNPCVVHGDLHEDNLMVHDGKVSALTGWTELRIGDPADDFAWLVASNENTFVQAVLHHYTQARRDTPDTHLLRRAALLAEFALAQYLVKAIAAGHQDMTAEAEGMLRSLAEDIVEHGGMPLTEEEAPETGANVTVTDIPKDSPAPVTVAAAQEHGAVTVTSVPEEDTDRAAEGAGGAAAAEKAASFEATPASEASAPEPTVDAPAQPAQPAQDAETETPDGGSSGSSASGTPVEDTATAAITVVDPPASQGTNRP